MKQSERDELLIRIDERVKIIAETTERQEDHLDQLNGQVGKNTTFRKITMWVVGVIVAVLIGLASSGNIGLKNEDNSMGSIDSNVSVCTYGTDSSTSVSQR